MERIIDGYRFSTDEDAPVLPEENKLVKKSVDK